MDPDTIRMDGNIATGIFGEDEAPSLSMCVWTRGRVGAEDIGVSKIGVLVDKCEVEEDDGRPFDGPMMRDDDGLGFEDPGVGRVAALRTCVFTGVAIDGLSPSHGSSLAVERISTCPYIGHE